MAEETLLLTLKLQADSKNAKTINDLVKANKQLAKVIKNAPKEGTEEYKKLEKTLDEAKKQYAKNRQEILAFNKELRTGVKENKKTNDSLSALSKNLKNLENQYRQLSAQERKTARGRELQKSIRNTRKELLKAEKSIGDFRRQVGNYTRSLVTLNSGIAGVAVSVGQLRAGLGGLVGAFRSAGASAKAFLLTLGPISLAIGAIVAGLSQFQSVIDAIKSTLSGVSAVFDVFAERFGRLGLAFTRLADFDFSGFATDAKNAFAGIGEEIANDFRETTRLSNALQDIRDREIDNIVRLAELERDISEQKRISAEKEKIDRAGAISAIEKAITLTETQRDIEVGLAQDRADALQQLVDLSKETTRVEERREALEQQAKVIKLQKTFNDQLRGLIRRREQLNSIRNKGNKDSLNALEALQKRQAELTKEIRLGILAREDISEKVTELKNVTEQLTDVDEEFKRLTEDVTKTVDFASGSVKAYNEELAKLRDELETVTIGSERYKQIQNQIAQTEAQRAQALGEIEMSINRLNEAQLKNLEILEDSQEALRLQSQAFDEIQALQGSAEEIARTRLEIESKLESDLRALRGNRIQEQKELLQDELDEVEKQLNDELELYADNELKKQEIQLIAQGKRDEIRKRELELEKELLEISKDEFDKSEKAKTDSVKNEESKRKELRDIAIDASIQASQKIVELLSVIQQQATEKQAEEIDKREERELAEAELVGKTEEEKQRIREKFEKEREELERKSANERKAIAISEAIINIAGSVIKALNSAPPTNVALASATAVLGALQLAIITATNFADGGLVVPVELDNGKIVNTPNIKQMRNGDNILATVRTGEVILNERQQQALGGPDTFRRIGVPGFANGGKVDLKPIAKASPFSTGGLTTRFTADVTKAKAFQGGGLANLKATRDVKKSIEAENEALFVGIQEAVFQGSAQGTKLGTESADITQQIKRQNERESRRNKNSSF